MNFEQELQALVDKYNIGEIEVSFKKTLVLKSLDIKSLNDNHTQNQSPVLAPEAELVDESADQYAARYVGGPVGRITT